MSANNMSDEELDKLFRQSAERYEPPFDPEAWKAMDRKLDGEQGIAAAAKRLLPVLLLALVVTMVTVWKLTDEPNPLAENVAVAENAEVQPATSSVDNRNGTEENVVTTLPEPESPTVHLPDAQAGSGAVPGARKETPSRSRRLAARQTLATVEQLQSVVPSIQVAEPGKSAPAIGVGRNLAHPAPQGAVLAKADTVTEVYQGEIAQAIPSDNSQAKVGKERVFLHNITMALVVAPDITTVRYKDPDAVSANAGVLFSVPLTKRLSLVSGAVWANKLYKARPEDYMPSPDYWDGKRLPDVIAAECRVLDIPLNLQYQVLEWGKNRLSVQAGLSSYLMLNEKYTYTYNYPGRDPYSKTREFSNDNRHWFGIQNLSVGYTRKLSPVLSVGAEPFVKIPLASIGEGRVKLSSAGVFFTAGYTFR